MLRPPSLIPTPVSLRCLFPHSSFVGCADIRVTKAAERSIECTPGCLFAAIPGTRVDGARFAAQAVELGAAALLVERPLTGIAVPQCVVPNARGAYARICAALAGNPSRDLATAAVTGTNGKTTVTWLLRSILQNAGRRTGLLGTVEYSDGVTASPAGLTTPDSHTLSDILERMVRLETTHAVMELSSHALDQDRVAGTELDVAVITNITQDHFDYHHDFDAYLASKARIAEHLKPGGLIVLNSDDPGCRMLEGQFAAEGYKIVTFAFDQPAELTAEILEESLDGTRFLLRRPDGRIEIHTPLVGRHNVSNALAAAAAADRFGLSADEIVTGIQAADRVPGRLERIDCGQACDVFVDYAHTDDALQRCLASLKQLTAGRLICVFGAGGDRDRSKRPLLGQAAAQADIPVVTSDNPRTENPDAIIADILSGFTPTQKHPFVEPDRAAAIRWALEHAGPGDCVLVAGKGHETEQIIGTASIPFDDREVIRSVLGELVRPPAASRERISA